MQITVHIYNTNILQTKQLIPSSNLDEIRKLTEENSSLILDAGYNKLLRLPWMKGMK